MPDENPDTGAFVGIFCREGGTMAARSHARQSVVSMCNRIVNALGEASAQRRTLIASCARVDFGLNSDGGNELGWCIMGVQWGFGINLYASADPQNAVVFVDTVLSSLVASLNYMTVV